MRLYTCLAISTVKSDATTLGISTSIGRLRDKASSHNEQHALTWQVGESTVMSARGAYNIIYKIEEVEIE